MTHLKDKYLLRGVLASNSTAHPDDVLIVRRMLQGAGLQAEENEAFPTSSLFNGIRKFQSEHGLTVDGEVKPGGETERSLREYLNLSNLTRCIKCGVLHGGVFSAVYCSDCFGKLRS